MTTKLCAECVRLSSLVLNFTFLTTRSEFGRGVSQGVHPGAEGRSLADDGDCDHRQRHPGGHRICHRHSAALKRGVSVVQSLLTKHNAALQQSG